MNAYPRADEQALGTAPHNAGDPPCLDLGPTALPCGPTGTLEPETQKEKKAQSAQRERHGRPRAPWRGRHNETYRTRGRWIYVRFRHPTTGRWHESCTRSTERRGAEKWYEILRAQLLGCTSDAAAETQVVALAASYMADGERRLLRVGGDTRQVSNLRARWRKLRLFLGTFGASRILRELTPERVRACVDQMAETRAPSTVHKLIAEVRAFVKVLIDRGDLSRDPTAGLRVRVQLKKVDRSLTPDQARRLLATAPTGFRRLYLLMLLETGARCGREVEAIRWRDLDAVRGLLHVAGTKTAGSDRVIRVRESLIATLLEHRGTASDDDAIVPRWSNARRDFGRIRREAGLPALRLTDLRHTYASWAIQAGVPTAVVAKALGHTGTAMVERVYGHLRPEHMSGMLAALPDLTVTDKEDQP